jgi:hypothetical protein
MPTIVLFCRISGKRAHERDQRRPQILRQLLWGACLGALVLHTRLSN